MKPSLHLSYPSTASLAVLATFLLGVFAPSPLAQGIILRGGMNFANAVTDPEPASPSNREYRRGFNAAALGEFGGGPVRVLLGAGYENKGMHITGGGGGDIRLDYMTIPIMLSFGTAQLGGGSYESSPRVFLNLGVEPGFLLSSDYATDDFTFSFDNAEEFDFNLRGEIGIEFPFSYSGPAGLVGLGYTYGLTDANSNGDEWHNYAIHAFFGLKI
jgi:hypothetical protein